MRVVRIWVLAACHLISPEPGRRPAMWHGRGHMQAAPPHGFHWSITQSALRRLQGCCTVQKTEKGAPLCALSSMRRFGSPLPLRVAGRFSICSDPTTIWTLYSTGCVCVVRRVVYAAEGGGVSSAHWIRPHGLVQNNSFLGDGDDVMPRTECSDHVPAP
jgi:hypothetical protein